MVYEVKEIDLSRIEAFAAYMDQGWAQQLVQGVASRAHQRWIQLIGERLQSSRLAYRAALHPPEEDGAGRMVIRLGGEGHQFAVMVEEGASAYDLRDTILKGRDYVRVPFRHRGADTGFGAPGVPAGFPFIASQGKEDALRLGRRVMRAAKKLGAGQRLPPGLAPKLKTGHTTDIFAAMARIRESGKKGAASRFLTWRTISKKQHSGDSTWMHPDITPKRLLDEVLADLDEIANALVDGLIDGALFAEREQIKGLFA
jgi:hypothetical protein